MFMWLYAFVALIVLSLLNSLLTSGATQYHYHGSRKWRTPRFTIFVKTWAGMVVVVFPFAYFLSSGGFWGAVDVALIGATLATTVIFAAGWLIFAGIELAIAGPEYFYRHLRDGGDPFFDCLPSPFNNDSPDVRDGFSPPDIGLHNFTPPASWTHVCPNCNAKQPGPVFWCWYCKVGYDHNRLAIKCPNCETVFVEPYPGALQRQNVSCTRCGQVVGMSGYNPPLEQPSQYQPPPTPPFPTVPIGWKP